MSTVRSRITSLRLTSPSSDRTPPRPGRCFDKLKTETAPKVPTARPSMSDSRACAASSMSGILSRAHCELSSATGSGRPWVLPVKTAAMLDHVASVTASTRMFPSWVETGALTGRRPAARAPKKTVSSSSGDMRMRSPGESRRRKARCMANRPDGMNTHSRPVRVSRFVSISCSSCLVMSSQVGCRLLLMKQDPALSRAGVTCGEHVVDSRCLERKSCGNRDRSCES
jgi:hypothetical protein